MASTGVTGLDLALVILACLLIIRLLTRAKSIPNGSYPHAPPAGLRLPPGPRGKPIIGNVTDWETFSQWAKEYGDLVHVKNLGQHIIFINSVDIARDLLEKRSSNFSDRIPLPMVNDLMGWDFSFPLMRYGLRWRTHRKMFHSKFHPAVATAYHDIQRKQTRATLALLRDSPDDFIAHLRHVTGAIIIEIVYGIKTAPTDDPYIARAEKAMKSLVIAENPGTFLVDVIPILKYVPAWMPGAGFRRKARVWREDVKDMVAAPFIAVKEALRAGTAQPSFTASLLEKILQKPDTAFNEEDVCNVAAAAYGAGADTTVSALVNFILAMVHYPDVQRKAQCELDSVIGMNRLPEFEDRENLPYINALCKEILRWHLVLPLGVGHRVMEDDIYQGYFIPKGTLMLGNTWFILHDEKNYGPKPDEFDPDRFLRPGVEDPTIAFGYGRRICPGRHVADNSLYIAVASILKTFDISHARNSSGKEIPIKISFSDGAIVHTEPFKCSIKLRSAAAENLIEEYADD